MLIHDYEQFFLLTVADLRDKLKRGTEYDIIRSCGLCRQVILDDNEPLVTLGNINRQLKIEFAINTAQYEISISGKKIIPTTFWKNLLPLPMLPTALKKIEINKFKNVVALTYEGHEVKIDHLVKAAAQFMGGVHSRPAHPQNKNEIALKAIYDHTAKAVGENIALSALKNICIIILLAMEPLENAIKGETPAGGSSPQC